MISTHLLDRVLPLGILNFILCLLISWTTFLLYLFVKRLYFSPISHIPGPKLAAMTQYYEFYFDIVLGGQYTFKIIELHKKYGPVVRINPWEVHVGDADFHSELYGGPGRRRDRWGFHAKQFGAPGSALGTLPHDLHRVRRSALNPFFSTRNIRGLQGVIEERVDALLRRFEYHAETSSEPLDLIYPFSAFANDIIHQFAFSWSNHFIEDPTFGRHNTDSLLRGTHMGNMVKHMNWLLSLVNWLPHKISADFVPGWAGFLKLRKDILNQIHDIRATQGIHSKSQGTIFHELLYSDLLSEEEKSVSRLAQEGQIFVQGGTLTTSWTLAIAAFHLLNRPTALRNLRDELFQAMPTVDTNMSLVALEKLPYLQAVVKESLRLAHGSSSRISRIAPDETLTVRDKETMTLYHIPPGTPMSMSVYKTLTDPAIFFDPFGFHPERWLQDGPRLDRYLMVFCPGTRPCLGMALAQAEVTMMIAKLFRRWGGGGTVGSTQDGDRRDGDSGSMSIFHTTVRDCEMAADYFIPIPDKGSKGIRVILEQRK